MPTSRTKEVLPVGMEKSLPQFARGARDDLVFTLLILAKQREKMRVGDLTLSQSSAKRLP